MTRRTIAKPVTITGVGLFTDKPAVATIEPAAPGLGIRFVHNSTHIHADIELLAQSPIPAFAHMQPRHTCLALGSSKATTTEHILAALVGAGISDANIALGSSGELPIGDGSASLFTDAINSVGTTPIAGDLAHIVLDEPITVSDNGSSITAEPADSPCYIYNFEPQPDSPLSPQSATWNASSDTFTTDIAPARTFSMHAEATQMQSLGLFTNFTPTDLLVLDGAGNPINNAFRYTNEPARHKLLDLVGDLALAGAPVIAKITATKSGHALNHQLAKRLYDLREHNDSFNL
jgi:UDP-3-O-[3-hydroxymyristoyl] N-acetylglucosamine deacetylase